jgi:predicted NBD/HSP70 family sugar kinase
LFERAGKVLGHGLANFIALMSPEKVIISGPGIRAFDHMRSGLQSGLESALVKDLIADTNVETALWNRDMTVLGVIALTLKAVD